MSLSKLTKIDREKGAIFKSHIDGKKFILSPEESIKIPEEVLIQISLWLWMNVQKIQIIKNISKTFNEAIYLLG